MTKWTRPEGTDRYDQYTNYPQRAEELANSPASVFSNHVVAIMRAEITAQYALLARLRHAGLLADPDRADPDLREVLRRVVARAEKVPYEELEKDDYQEHIGMILAALLAWENQRMEKSDD